MPKRPTATKKAATPAGAGRPITIRYVAIGELKASARNPRKIKPLAMQKLKASIKAYGVVDPIIARAGGEVVGGHQRLDACRDLGHATVPVVFLEDLTDEQARLLNIGLNGTGGEWDWEALGQELLELKPLDIDLMPTGLSSTDVARAVKAVTAPLDELEETEVGPPKKARAQPGEVWLLGSHRLMCGDATDPANVEALLAGATPGIMVTDPPYGVDYHPEWRKAVAEARGLKARHRVGKVMNDDRADWTPAWELFAGAVAYVWHSALRGGEVGESLRAAGLELRSQIIWNKQIITFSRGDYHWRHEPCWYAVRKGGRADWAGDRKQATVWDIATLHVHGGGPEAGKQTNHSTQKPIACMERAIRNHEAGEVYDPFVGSGTTLIACERAERRCFAMELDPIYVDVALERWEAHTGKKARRDGRAG